jgi:hypothetical protein
MTVLAAAVILVGLICGADLLLTFGVLRRLREHAEQISSLGQAGGAAVPVVGLAPGESPTVFASATMEGLPITGPTHMRMAAFFSASCSACPGQVDPFLDYVATHQLTSDSVLVVVLGSPDARPAYLDDLSSVGQIVFEEIDGPIFEAFKVSGFPAFCLLDGDGALLASGFDAATLPEPSAAR